MAGAHMLVREGPSYLLRVYLNFILEPTLYSSGSCLLLSTSCFIGCVAMYRFEIWKLLFHCLIKGVWV